MPFIVSRCNQAGEAGLQIGFWRNVNPWRLVILFKFEPCYQVFWGTQWRSWLRHCATNRKVAFSIPDGVTGIFHSQSFGAALWTWG